ncbi:MAG: protein phosphatase 2C domain-containing protein [Endomicrobium sp.]|jgi:protein phosphatase|nr:protein phosphatase 2C domain-containing protein [Endomicrobium sp.]
MKVSYYAKTDIGLLRTENQDFYGIGEDFYVVCDGMGGGVAGAFASQLAVEVILKSYKTISDEQVRDIIGTDLSKIGNDIAIAIPIVTVMLANRILYNLTVKYPKLAGMGTTLVMCKIDRQYNVLNVYHVGDSRLYRIREGNIKLLTKDHSKINDLLDVGKIAESDIKFIENQSIITRALGIASSVKVDYQQYDYKPGDFYIMCSDGLNGQIDDNSIKDIVNRNSANLAFTVNGLISSANHAGGKDNTTVIVFTIDDDGQPVQLSKDICKSILSFSDDDLEKNLYEDRILKKTSKKLTVEIPKNLIQEKKIKNTYIYIVAFIIVLAFFVYYFFAKKNEKKLYNEKLNEVSGIILNIRHLKKDKLKTIIEVDNYHYRRQLLEEAKSFYKNYSFNFINAIVFIEEKNGYNKFIALSGNYPIKIYLPIGEYRMLLEYPRYSLVDNNLNIVKYLDLSISLTGGLEEKVILMVPNSLGE